MANILETDVDVFITYLLGYILYFGNIDVIHLLSFLSLWNITKQRFFKNLDNSRYYAEKDNGLIIFLAIS